MKSKKPIILLCSTTERMPVINTLEALIKREYEVRLWYRDCFPPGSFTWEAVEKAIRAADFVVLIVAGEDIIRSRLRQQKAPRDNIVLETGLSLSVLGRERAFLLSSQAERPKIPTDLSGLTLIPYKATPAGLKKTAEALRTAMKNTGPRDRFQDGEISVPYKSRAETSARFLESAINSVDSLGGDLSWLQKNLSTFAALVKRRVRVRFLTNVKSAPSIREAKRLGISFREYAKGDTPPAKGIIIDSESERNSSALFVRKVRFHAHLRSPDSQ